MINYIIKRVLNLIPVLLVVFTVVFLIMHIAPGDPASIMLGPEATTEQVENLRNQLGLDQPLYQQYFDWILNAIQGDLGTSYFLEQPVLEAILSHIGPTVELTIIAMFLSILIALPLGILAAKFRGTTLDYSFMGMALMGISVPSFLFGLFFILIFAVGLDWLPAAGYQPLSSGIWSHFKYLIMPGFALGAMQAALIARMSRSSMLDTLSKDFIKAARAKGLKEFSIIFKHALSNSILPILTVVGQSLGGLITGAVVIETIFNIPGIGQLMINSITRRDFTVIQGTVLFVTTAFVFVNLLVDILYGFFDPRVRLDKK